jgi:hypothetical protein
MGKKSPQLPKEQKLLTLPLFVLPADQDRISQRMAELLEQINATEEKKKATVAAFTGELKTAAEQLHELGRAIRTGVEQREIVCELAYDFKKGEITTTRLDTGETVSVREMTDEERQLELDFEGGGK